MKFSTICKVLKKIGSISGTNKRAKEVFKKKYPDNISANSYYVEGFNDGFNQANEWHDLRKNPEDLPKESGKYMVAVSDENGFIETDIARFELSSGWEYFDVFIDNYGREHAIAWKEYPTFYE